VVRALEALVPHLEQLGMPRVTAEGRSLPSVRQTAQRALFRLIQPYSFQQRQFQEALISALLSSVRTLAGEVQALASDVKAGRLEGDAARARAEGRMAEVEARLETLGAADAELAASLSTISERLFAVPFDPGPGRERFLQRAPGGEVRLGYGSPNGVNGH